MAQYDLTHHFDEIVGYESEPAPMLGSSVHIVYKQTYPPSIVTGPDGYHSSVRNALCETFVDVVVDFRAAIENINLKRDIVKAYQNGRGVPGFTALALRNAIPCDESFREKMQGENFNREILVLVGFSDNSKAWNTEDVNAAILKRYGVKNPR